MKHIASAACLAVEQLENRTLLTAVAGWTTLASAPKARGLSTNLRLADFQPLTLTVGTIANTLSKVPLENLKYGIGRGVNSRLVSIPTPDGEFDQFRIVESSILTGADAKKFSSIKTYAGVGVDDPSATVRLDFTPLGFHAQVLTLGGKGAYYIDPYFNLNRTVYASYYRSDLKPGTTPPCLCGGAGCAMCQTATASLSKTVGKTKADTESAVGGLSRSVASTASRTSGNAGAAVSLRTYRLAVAATGEYTAAVGGGTVAGGQAAIVTAINRVSGIYETELAIRLSLVGNNSTLVYTNASTDPYSNTNPSSLLSQNQSTIDSVIGSANYDIGHVFSTGGGGLAGLGVVGINGQKARAETGLSNPTGDAFYVDYVAHEMGHQFGANHTFNTANDTGNRSSANAYEPGSGSTIMAYAGLEGTDDLQPNSQPYFAWRSLDEILTHVDVTIPGVGTRTATGNTIPTVSGPGNFTIPSNTPFALTATGTDPNGDPIYYSWEEADLGPAINLTTPDNGSSPLFRVYDPVTDPTRTFPQLASILSGANGTSAPSGGGLVERLPTTNRTMKFVITARDKRAGAGGTNVLSGTTTNVTSVAAASSFGISNFNSAATVAGGSSQAITWNVAGTTGNGINTSQVNILMSTDGGTTFPTTLAASTANDGTETVQMPFGTASTAVRFKVAAVGNIYFDINNANLSITNVSTPSATPGIPDLVAATDTGISTTDNITNRNNSAAAKTLQFSISGTVSGATVNILSDGISIGSAVASGTTTTVNTNGSAFSTLTNASHNFTATQTETGKTVSAASAALPVTIDAVAPTLNGTPAFTYLTVGPRVAYTFSEPVAFAAGLAGVTNTTTNTAVLTSSITATPAGNTVTLSFANVPTAPATNLLPNGNYSITPSGGAVITDVAGNALSGSIATTFFWLNGDANRSRTVDFNDFLALQNGFNVPGNYGTGDFNYDGVVDFNDFLLLQNNFNVTV